MDSKHSREDERADQARAAEQARLAYLRRVSVVFAHEIRMKIVSELFQREMSPSQFFKEFGGRSISRVDRHFKRLAGTGWLEYIRQEGPDSSRRGSVEHFYRATELAIIDAETWALVPYSLRVATSWRTFEALCNLVREALEADTLDARIDSHLSYTTLNLDQSGWDRVVGVVDAYLETILREQRDSRERVAKTCEKQMAATIGLVAFESPACPPTESTRRMPVLIKPEEKSSQPFPMRVSKVFSDQIALKILAEANVRDITVSMMHAKIGGVSKFDIRRRFKKLQVNGWLVQVREETGGKRRAGVEVFYRATAPVIADTECWAAVPPNLKSSQSWNLFCVLRDRVEEAVNAGTFDARLDNHLSWTVLRLDQQGWENISTALDRVLAFVLAEKDRAENRLEASGEPPITTTVGLLAFESPRSVARKSEI